MTPEWRGDLLRRPPAPTRVKQLPSELPRKALAGVIAHGPVVPGVAQSKAQSGATRGLTLEVALQEDVRPVSSPDFDASDLWVARAKAHVTEQLCRLPASEALFR